MFAYGQMLETTHLPMAYYSSAEKDELVTYLSPVNTQGIWQPGKSQSYKLAYRPTPETSTAALK